MNLNRLNLMDKSRHFGTKWDEEPLRSRYLLYYYGIKDKKREGGTFFGRVMFLKKAFIGETHFSGKPYYSGVAYFPGEAHFTRESYFSKEAFIGETYFWEEPYFSG